METKICKKCGRELPIEEFEEENFNGRLYRRKTCRKCRAIYRKERRAIVPNIYKAQQKRHQERLTTFLYENKTPCIVCGESEPVCIDFHHLDSGSKEFSIGKGRSKGKEKILDEISKCVCLCANCHRKVHAGLINLDEYLSNESPLCTTGEGVTE